MFRFFYCLLFLGIVRGGMTQEISVTDWKPVIPGEKLTQLLRTRNSNNNLDLTEFHGRFYLAFRTAPTHFASSKTKLYILSTHNFEEWQFEKEIFLKADLREPRFFKTRDTLFLMFYKGGRNLLKFEPAGVYVTMKTGNQWNEEKEVLLPHGYVPWRIKRFRDMFYLSAYDGKNEYKLKTACESRLFKSNDGYHWKAISQTPQIHHPRASAECEFEFTRDGNLWGIARLEYDGSYIFHASKDSLHRWQTWYSKYKFDSPLIFSHGGKLYLISRRNLDGNGVFYRKENKFRSNLYRYSLTKKTTALFELDTARRVLIHIMDFESTGDCAYPAITRISDSSYLVLNYSSPITKRKKAWLWGQLGKTYIYMAVLTFANRHYNVSNYDKKAVFRFE